MLVYVSGVNVVSGGRISSGNKIRVSDKAPRSSLRHTAHTRLVLKWKRLKNIKSLYLTKIVRPFKLLIYYILYFGLIYKFLNLLNNLSVLVYINFSHN